VSSLRWACNVEGRSSSFFFVALRGVGRRPLIYVKKVLP